MAVISLQTKEDNMRNKIITNISLLISTVCLISILFVSKRYTESLLLLFVLFFAISMGISIWSEHQKD